MAVGRQPKRRPTGLHHLNLALGHASAVCCHAPIVEQHTEGSTECRSDTCHRQNLGVPGPLQLLRSAMPDDIAAGVAVVQEAGGINLMRNLSKLPPATTFTTSDIARMLEEVLEPPFNSTAKADRFTHRMVAIGMFIVDQPAAGRRGATYTLNREHLQRCLRRIADYANGK